MSLQSSPSAIMKFPHSLSLDCLVLSVAACKQDREIKVYRVAKETPPGSPPATGRIPTPACPA